MMSWLTDIFKEVPTAGVAKERIEFLQAKLADAEKENATLKEKVTSLEAESETFKTRIANLEQENNRLQEQVRVQAEGDSLDENALQIIGILAKNGSTLKLQELEYLTQLPRTQVKYTVEHLIEHKYLQMFRPNPVRPETYGLAQRGRKFALENNFVGG
jgi:predicted nuclease with TOPRIM domain